MKSYKIITRFVYRGLRFIKGDVFITDEKSGILVYDENETLPVNNVGEELTALLEENAQEM